MKKILTLLLVAVAVGGAIVAIYRTKESIPPENADVAVVEPETVAQADLVEVPKPVHLVKVIYFTTDVRCVSCLKIEELTRRTVETQFASQLQDGSLIFQLINVDRPNNAHFIEEYQLVSKTVVVAEFEKGVQEEWVNLQDVWLKFNDEEEFESYVSEAISALL